MKNKENTAIRGWINGFIGVVCFSGSLPATKVAVLDFNPIFLTTARATIAGLLALILILIFKEKHPKKSQIFPLIIVAFGGVIGFPLLTALALQHVTSAHSIVFLGLLPLCTAIFGVIRGGEKPKLGFWIFSIIGSLLVISFAFQHGISGSGWGDFLMLASIIVCGLGYAEGATLTHDLGGWQVISWALILSLPVMILISWMTLPNTFTNISYPAWFSLGYVSLFSMLIAFIFWYNGLAQGGIAAVGQLQLLQPFMGLLISSILLKETISPLMIYITMGVILCVFASKKFTK